MEYLLELPDDIFKHHIMQYLSIHDVVGLDNACRNHLYRKQLLDKMINVSLIQNFNEEWSLRLLGWLEKRKIFL